MEGSARKLSQLRLGLWVPVCLFDEVGVLRLYRE
jgi:hypothetical protein